MYPLLSAACRLNRDGEGGLRIPHSTEYSTGYSTGSVLKSPSLSTSALLLPYVSQNRVSGQPSGQSSKYRSGVLKKISDIRAKYVGGLDQYSDDSNQNIERQNKLSKSGSDYSTRGLLSIQFNQSDQVEQAHQDNKSESQQPMSPEALLNRIDSYVSGYRYMGKLNNSTKNKTTKADNINNTSRPLGTEETRKIDTSYEVADGNSGYQEDAKGRLDAYSGQSQISRLKGLSTTFGGLSGGLTFGSSPFGGSLYHPVSQGIFSSNRNGTVQENPIQILVLKQDNRPLSNNLTSGPMDAVATGAGISPSIDTGSLSEFIGTDDDTEPTLQKVGDSSLSVESVVPNLGSRRRRRGYKPKLGYEGGSGLDRSERDTTQMATRGSNVRYESPPPRETGDIGDAVENNGNQVADEAQGDDQGTGEKDSKQGGEQGGDQVTGEGNNQQNKDGLGTGAGNGQQTVADVLSAQRGGKSTVKKAAPRVALKAAKSGGLLAKLGSAIAALFSSPVGWVILILIIILVLIILVVNNTRPATETAANDVIRNSMSKLTTGNLIIVTYPRNVQAQSMSYNAASEIQIQPKRTDNGRNIYEFRFVAKYQIDLENFINKVFYGASGLMEEYDVIITKIQEKIKFNSSIVGITNISFFDEADRKLSASPNYTIATDEETGLSNITWTAEKSWWDSSLSYPCSMNQNSEKKCAGDVTFSIDYFVRNNPNDFMSHIFSLSHELKADIRIIRKGMGAQVSNYSLPEIVYNLCRSRTGGVFLCQVGSPGQEDGENPWAGMTIEGSRNEAVSIDDLFLACPLDKNNTIQCTAGRNYPRNLNNEYAGKSHNALDLVPNSTEKTVYVASEAQRIKINNTNPMCGATVILYNGSFATLYAHVDGDSIASTSASLKNAMDQQNNVVEINDMQIGSEMGRLKAINGNTYFSNGTLCATGTHLHFTILKTDGTPVEGLYDKVNQACEGKITRCPDE